MSKRTPFKDHKQETRLFSRRLWLCALVALTLILFLMSRLIYLQIIEHQKYVTLSDKNRISMLPVAPKRGLIFDRHGVLLADNVPAFSLQLTPELIDDFDQTIKELQTVITIDDDDIQTFKKQLRNKRRFESIPLRFKLTEKELANFAENRHRFPGVDVVAGLVRYYPQGDLMAHSVGYVGRINSTELDNIDKINYSATQHIGKTGVEKFYESRLHGDVGYQQVETDVKGRWVRVLEQQSPTAGMDLYLSLDARLHQAAKIALGERRGAVIAIEPKTGEILALVSYPAFDPNLFVLGVPQKIYTQLQKDSDQPLYDRALRGQYPPGSTIKPLMGMLALDQSIINPYQRFYDPGWYKLPNSEHLYRNWKRSGHGWVDMHDAITVSNTTYFYALAQQLGITRMQKGLEMFGFGEKTQVDVAGELTGLVPSVEWKRSRLKQGWYPGETLITGIGQGYILVTPIQLAKYVSTVANRGMVIQPHVLMNSKTAHQDIIPYQAPALSSIPLQSQMPWDFMVNAMNSVTADQRGTAYAAFRGTPYSVAGKTGTAQVFGIKQGEKYNANELTERQRDHSLFIGFAPVDDPKIALAVIVENSTASALVARSVFDAYLIRDEP